MTLTDLFGDSSRMRLLDFLADHVDFDYTITQMSEFAGVSRPALYGLVERLAKEGLISMTRTVGDSRFYRLNLEDPRVLSMLQMDFSSTNELLESGKFAGGGSGKPRPVAEARASLRAGGATPKRPGYGIAAGGAKRE